MTREISPSGSRLPVSGMPSGGAARKCPWVGFRHWVSSGQTVASPPHRSAAGDSGHPSTTAEIPSAALPVHSTGRWTGGTTGMDSCRRQQPFDSGRLTLGAGRIALPVRSHNLFKNRPTLLALVFKNRHFLFSSCFPAGPGAGGNPFSHKPPKLATGTRGCTTPCRVLVTRTGGSNRPGLPGNDECAESRASCDKISIPGSAPRAVPPRGGRPR